MQSKRRPLLLSLKGTSHLRFKSKITLRMFDRGGDGEGEIIFVMCLLFALV